MEDFIGGDGTAGDFCKVKKHGAEVLANKVAGQVVAQAGRNAVEVGKGGEDGGMMGRSRRCMNMNVCARRAQKPSLLGLCRVAAKRLLKTNVFVKPDEQSRVYSNFAMARIFVQASAEPNLFGLCRAQPKMW